MSDNTFPFVSVILPAKNEEKYIGDTLRALMQQDYPKDRMEVIVVDNISSDRTPEIVKKFGARLITFEGSPVGAVRNYGFKESIGKVIFFIDSDCVSPKNWVSNGVKELEKNEKFVLGGGCYLREKPYFIERYWLLNSKTGTTLPKDLIGASIAIHRGAFEKSGMFPEDITSGEDTKLSQNLVRFGYNVQMTNEMSVAHLGNPITVKEFYLRQVWHSENYFQDIKSSFRDPIFFISLLFLSLLFLFLASTFLLQSKSLSILLLLLVLPAILSVKRIIRSGLLSHFFQLPAIYTLDLIYLCGRSSGLILSLKNKIKHHN